MGIIWAQLFYKREFQYAILSAWQIPDMLHFIILPFHPYAISTYWIIADWKVMINLRTKLTRNF
jgi:hypothetical protein